MASFYDKYYASQPGFVKAVIAVGIAFGGYKIYQYYQEQERLKGLNLLTNSAGTELDQLAQQGVRPSYSDSTFESFSQQLQGAMTGCGTDEGVIYSVMQQMNNEADVRRLIQIFDVRYYIPCQYSNPIDWLQYTLNSKAFPGNLAQWLAFDLSTSELAKVNSTLASKGITFKF
jgi:hypothetical protein